MRLFVYTQLQAPARELLRGQLPADVTISYNADLPEAGREAAFQQAEVVLGNVPRAWFAAGPPPGLRFWQIDSAGIDQYAGLQLSCPVANMGDYFAWPCAETMVAGILGWYRHIPELAVLQAEKRWVGAPIRTRQGLLRGKRVIILGAGAIGLAVREQLRGFGCPVQLLARHSPAAQLHSREELLRELPDTDVVVNCLPGSAANFFSAELIAALPPRALYASVGRGNTTDEAALLAALQAGRLAGAVLDVTLTEPLPAEHPFWSMPQVLLTQHTGGGQPDEEGGKASQLLRNLHHLLQGEPLEDLVDLGRGY